jgi:hypothetical protein
VSDAAGEDQSATGVAGERRWRRRRVSRIGAVLDALAAALVGRAATPPADLVARFPELAEVRWRRGGLPLRIGGWCLGQRTVAGITLWRTVFLAEGIGWPPALLLHEFAHVRQFARDAAFPVRYCLESLRRGYAANRYEREADAHAARALAAVGRTPPDDGATRA